MCARLVCFFLPLDDVSWLTHACTNQCFRQWLKSPSRCAHNTTNVYRKWMMFYVVGRLFLLDANMPRFRLSVLVDVACHWLTSHARYSHSIYAHAGLRWNRMQLVDIACHMRTCPTICMHDFDDSVSHFSTSTFWYVNATYDAGRPHLLSEDQCVKVKNDVRRPHLISADRCCMLHKTLASNVWRQ